MQLAILALVLLVHWLVHAHTPERDQGDEARLKELESKWGIDWAFSGISTFAHLPYIKCLSDPDVEFDIAVIGAPFDTAVSYRPGKTQIRLASKRCTTCS